MQKVEGKIVDLAKMEIYSGTVYFDKRIRKIEPNDNSYSNYVVPGYIDSHIHVESTMLTPFNFSAVAALHGTSAVVADPHEIANVFGMKGIDFMVQDSKNCFIDFYFTAPSCVPATDFERSGGRIGPEEIKKLLDRDKFVALGEMMNYPGVIHGDKECLEKIEIAKACGKPIDGHCPGLSGNDLRKYISRGISTDHESSSFEEADEKCRAGMKVLVREGSSARNLFSLVAVEKAFGFSTDDKHVGDLLRDGHIDHILNMAVSFGKDPIEALKMATINPASHYRLEGGMINVGAISNILVVENLSSFQPLKVFFHGKLIAKNGKLTVPAIRKTQGISQMNARSLSPNDLKIDAKQGHVKVIGARDGQLITDSLRMAADDIDSNLQKIIVLDRYSRNPPSIGLVKGLDMKDCALAQTIAHDSHNIIATGSSDELIACAINNIISMKGGIVAMSCDDEVSVTLDVGGLMSTKNAIDVGSEVEKLEAFFVNHDVVIKNIVTTLSFMALLVIPHLKISDKGLFDVDSFTFTDIVGED
ncbi:MAG: adenine deaminase [Candidatus Methanofastidiosia archaeon]